MWPAVVGISCTSKFVSRTRLAVWSILGKIVLNVRILTHFVMLNVLTWKDQLSNYKAKMTNTISILFPSISQNRSTILTICLPLASLVKCSTAHSSVLNTQIPAWIPTTKISTPKVGKQQMLDQGSTSATLSPNQNQRHSMLSKLKESKETTSKNSISSTQLMMSTISVYRGCSIVRDRGRILPLCTSRVFMRNR